MSTQTRRSLPCIVVFAACTATAVGLESAPDLLREALVDFERHAESVWHAAPAPAGSGYFGDGVSAGNAGIRGTCGVALAYAVLARELPGDPERSRRVERSIAALRYAAGTHRGVGKALCVDGKSWGFGWQTALWSGTMGFACALLGAEAPGDLVLDCRRIVAAEADRLAGIPPPSGSRGDSKAEENAWNSNVLALAAAWMADAPQAPVWADGARRYLANTYTVPDPAEGPLRDWITTTNLLPSYAMENHGFFHPSYQMVSGMSLGDSLLMATLLNRSLAESLRPFAEHNVLPVWHCLQQVLLDSGELAYPSGLDWSLHGYGQVSYYAWLATHFQDPLARWAGEALARLLRQRQRVNGDGRFAGESCPNGFYHEAVAARRVAIALLHYRSGPPPPPPTAPGPFAAHLPDVRLLLHRSAHGFAAVSYGARVMGLVHPSAAAHADAPFVTTPLAPGLLTINGLLPRHAELRDVTVDDGGFACTLDLSDGFLSVCRVRVVSTGDSLALLELPGGDLPRRAPMAFPVGIENHPLTGPARLVAWDGGTRRVAERSGERFEAPAAGLSVDGRLGYLAGPDGRLVYAAAAGHNRNGAAEDKLTHVPDSSAAPRYAILLPGADLTTVQRVRASVAFGTADGVATLRYVTPGAAEAVLRIAADLPPPPFVRLPVPCEVRAANHHQRFPGSHMVDGDPETFWVSSPDGVAVVPGNGPTAARPEVIDVLFPKSVVGGVLIVPRPHYGPRTLRLEVAGEVAFSGAMRHEPLAVRLRTPVAVESLSLVVTSSHDPLHPNAPRNVQIAEIILLAPSGAPAQRTERQ